MRANDSICYLSDAKFGVRSTGPDYDIIPKRIDSSVRLYNVASKNPLELITPQ